VPNLKIRQKKNAENTQKIDFMSSENNLLGALKEFTDLISNANKASESMSRFSKYLTLFTLFSILATSVVINFYDVSKEYYWGFFAFISIVLLIDKFIIYMIRGFINRCGEAGVELIKK
jgi:hypothetical protein